MRYIAVLLVGAALAATPASAADELKFGPVPAWVIPQDIPAKATKAAEAPVATLLNDAQVRLERGKVTSFTDIALKIQNSDGLAAGNIAFQWQPATDTVTVNKLHIIRDGKVIDVLKSGQTFTIARRETNMETAMLDGTLTANIQPEGLEIGDIINLAVTNEQVDPVMKGHVETTYALWNDTLERGHVRISWPKALKLVDRQTDNLPLPKRLAQGEWNVIELASNGVEPLLVPSDAPMRFRIGRAGEITDFQSWSDVAELMAPLYREAAVIPKSGPLRDEIERIRQSAKTDKERAERALQLVEERVRYVALVMGTGGYVPASAEHTWSRRFGDCKAKSALLVAILREFGIEAVPVAVHSRIGDALPRLLPMVRYFDHVVVRAKIGGKTYWLDGTRSGDFQLDRVPVPGFKWGLPLEPGAVLVPIVQPPLVQPDTETAIEIDASSGLLAVARFTIEQTFRGDSARASNLLYSRMSAAQADQMMRAHWRRRYDYVDVETVAWAFDKELAELRLSMTGNATLDWSDDGWFYVPESTIGYEPNFERAPGPFRNSPVEIAYPAWEKASVAIQLPASFSAVQTKVPQPVREELAGVEYIRNVRLIDSRLSVDTQERALASEIPYKDAVAAKGRLKALYDEDAYLRIPTAYRATEADLHGLAARKLSRASELVWRGHFYLDAAKYDEAIADFTEANRLDPTNGWALANRGISYVWKREFAEAERDLAAAEAIDPANYVILRARGLLARFKEDDDTAVEYFTKALAHDPGNFALFHRAFAYSNQGKFELAIADFSTILAQQPIHVGALAGRASAYRSLDQDEKALADSELALKSGNAPPDLRLLRANLFRGQGKHVLVLNEAERLMEEHPKSVYALVAAAKIFASESRREKALEAFDRALAIDREAYIYVNRSEVRHPTDHAGRMADLNEAIKLDPRHAIALARKASLLFKQKHYAEALQAYDAAIAVSDGDALGIHRDRAIALYKIGKVDEAEKAFAEIGAKSNEAGDLNGLCWDKATAGILLETALEDCRRALQLRPGTPAYLDSLGMALMRLDRLDEALEAYDQALSKNRFAAALMGRAIVHARKGDLRRASADRAEALKLSPNIEADFAEYGVAMPAADASGDSI